MAIDKGVESPVMSEVGNEEVGVQHVVIEEEISIDPEEERKLLCKIDLRVMSLLFFMYFFKYASLEIPLFSV
jgi:hypothetical protein